MEPDPNAVEPPHPGTLSRGERRAMGFRMKRRPLHHALSAGEPMTVSLLWQFKSQRDQGRRTPRLDGQPRRWQVERERRRSA